MNEEKGKTQSRKNLEEGGVSPPARSSLPSDPPGTAPTEDVSKGACKEAIKKLMRLVNHMDMDLPARTLEPELLAPSDRPSHAVMQRAMVYRRELLAVLALFNVKAIDEVGVPVDYGRHRAEFAVATGEPDLHRKVAACLMTGFTCSNRTCPARVTVFEYTPREEVGDEENGKEDRANG